MGPHSKRGERDERLEGSIPSGSAIIGCYSSVDRAQTWYV
jgi:hypothetical protein